MRFTRPELSVQPPGFLGGEREAVSRGVLIEFIFDLDIERWRLGGERAERQSSQRNRHTFAFPGERRGVGNLWRLGKLDKVVLNRGDAVAGWRAVDEDAQRFGGLLLLRALVDVTDLRRWNLTTHEVFGEPRENLRARTFVVGMSTRGLDEAEVPTGSQFARSEEHTSELQSR